MKGLNRILVQAAFGAFIFWIFKMILGKSFSAGAMLQEAGYALVFGVFYVAFLLIRDRYFGKKKKE